MFSQQQQQDGRQQQMSGIHMQQQGQMSNMPQQISMQMGQQPMGGGMPGPSSGVPQQAPGGMQRLLGSIGPQHSMTAPGVTQQQINVMNSGVRPVGNVGIPLQQPGGILLNNPDVSQQTTQIQGQRMSATNQQQSSAQDGQHAAQQHAGVDRIEQFKLLLPQLKECLVNLISVARQNFAANAATDNLEKSIDTTLLPRFDKALEQFYSICNQIELHLMLASDQISHTLYSMQYTPINANQMRDNTNLQAYTNYITIVKQQLACAKEIQSTLSDSSNKILVRQGLLQQHNVQPGPRQQQF